MKLRREVIVGATYRHKPSGGLYRVDALHHDATDYEKTGKVKLDGTVLYTQLYHGSFLRGTKWTRGAADFLRHFEHVKK